MKTSSDLTADPSHHVNGNDKMVSRFAGWKRRGRGSWHPL